MPNRALTFVYIVEALPGLNSDERIKLVDCILTGTENRVSLELKSLKTILKKYLLHLYTNEDSTLFRENFKFIECCFEIKLDDNVTNDSFTKFIHKLENNNLKENGLIPTGQQLEILTCLRKVIHTFEKYNDNDFFSLIAGYSVYAQTIIISQTEFLHSLKAESISKIKNNLNF